MPVPKGHKGPLELMCKATDESYNTQVGAAGLWLFQSPCGWVDEPLCKASDWTAAHMQALSAPVCGWRCRMLQLVCSLRLAAALPSAQHHSPFPAMPCSRRRRPPFGTCAA